MTSLIQPCGGKKGWMSMENKAYIYTLSNLVRMVNECSLYKDCDECKYIKDCDHFKQSYGVTPYDFKQELKKDDRLDKGQ